ncbi:MAG: transglycosylase SLT domain-containing protein [Bacteroidota bacterium]
MQKYRPKFERPGSVNYAGTMGASSNSTRIARPAPGNLQGNFKQILIVVGCVFLTNILSHTFFNPSMDAGFASAPESKILPPEQELYLMDKASLFVPDTKNFERKVREIANQLKVAPEWLMAVMYSESKFDASVKNFKGSGATGLIQFMPAAASELNVSLKRLSMMTHEQQMEYVFMYLQNVRDRYGDFESLTDLYLAILYPKAINQDYCYTLYAKPSQSYHQNSGLDENKDGRVTISDIDRRMQRLYPTAYISQK